ncbi:MAG: hypothetical protein IJC99_06115 [Clostridia bacterium]|nr:hypothetical protein [Clostridia bacterium]
MEQYLTSIRGNQALRERLGEELRSGLFPHAHIIEGASGFGKHLLATEIAMSLACESRTKAGTPLPCGTCRNCRRIKRGNCPDIITVSKGERATMGVETIRTLREGLATVPNDLDVKIYIIEDAHTMTVQAQNALLLTLEEPPSFVVFLLLAEDSGALLETVRSRAPTHRLQPIDRETMRDFLLTDTAARAAGAAGLATERPAEFEALLSLAAGSIGKALLLLDGEKRAPLIERISRVSELVNCLLDRKAPDRLLLALQALGTARDAVHADLSMLQLALRDLLLLGRTEQAALLFYTDTDAAAELATRFTGAGIFALSAAVDSALEALAANANVRLTIINLFNQLCTS